MVFYYFVALIGFVLLNIALSILYLLSGAFQIWYMIYVHNGGYGYAHKRLIAKLHYASKSVLILGFFLLGSHTSALYISMVCSRYDYTSVAKNRWKDTGNFLIGY